MSTELDYDNVVNAIKGEAIVRSCVSCKHYRGGFLTVDNCVRQLELKYHPITGKKAWMGMTHTCKDDRCLGDGRRPTEPCGPDGKFWKEKEKIKWFSSWFKEEK